MSQPPDLSVPKALTVVAAVVVLAVAVLLPGPVDAGGEPEGNAFTVVKVVDGDAPADAVFEVTVTCDATTGSEADPALITPVLQFDANGTPIGDHMVIVPQGRSCTATETVTNGASVSYACASGTSSQVTCDGDQTIHFGDVEGAEGTITVTNTYADAAPADAAPADVVAATPTFTG